MRSWIAWGLLLWVVVYLGQGCESTTPKEAAARDGIVTDFKASETVGPADASEGVPEPGKGEQSSSTPEPVPESRATPERAVAPEPQARTEPEPSGPDAGSPEAPPEKPNPAPQFVGFGAVTRGAASSPSGAAVYRVTTLKDSGPGSLRDAVSKGSRRIVFDVSGTITLLSPLYVRQDYLTIDGQTAQQGITITQPPGKDIGFIVAGTRRHTHDIVIRHVRFKGTYDVVKTHKVGSAILSFDGDCGKIKCVGDWSKADGGISNVVLDHISVLYDRDKTTFWGKIRNVTLSNSLFYGSNKALLLSFYSAPYDLQRKGISIFRNVFLDNGERNPQLRGWIEDLDMANNAIAGWTWYGVRIKNEAGEKKVHLNLRNNRFLDTNKSAKNALIYLGDKPPSSCLKQGSVYGQSEMGKLWVSGNLLPASNCDQYSTIQAPLPIPKAAQLPIQPASSLCDLVPKVGPSPRSALEKQALQKLAAGLSCP